MAESYSWRESESSKYYLGRLTACDLKSHLSRDSVLCLPIGAWEQHGPHLPLNTDTILADRFAFQVAEHWHKEHDIWILPSIPYGLSREHSWSAGTVSLTVRVFSELLLGLCEQIAISMRVTNLLIINGHGGNRGILEVLIYEMEDRFGLNVCVTHPTALATVRSGSPLPEVHGGMSETSVMLAIAPGEVQMDCIPEDYIADVSASNAIRETIMSRGTTWPWRSNDPSIATLGIIGDARKATAELGCRIVESSLAEYGNVLSRLAERGRRCG
jgi:creatinine amidohydrolase